MNLTIEHHVFIHGEVKLDQILAQLKQLTQQEKQIMATLDEALTDIQSEATVADSLVTLTASIKAQLDAVLSGQLPPAQQAKVDAIFAAVEANKQKLSDAVVANTPAA